VYCGARRASPPPRIAANIAKLPELRRGKSFTPRMGHRQIGLNVKVDRRETD
jgi:hypothetical protein